MLRTVVAAVAFALCAGVATAAEVGGVKLDDKASVGGQELVLNGAGVRTRVILKIYVGSLYVPAKASNAAAVYAKAPRRVQLNMLRDVSADQMLDALVDGIKDGNPPADVAAVKPQSDQLASILKGIGQLKEGNVLSFDYVDGGAEDERTLSGNRASFERLRFRPRTLVDVSVRDTSTTILGHAASFPAIIGPTGLNGLQWPDGDLAIARATAAAGLPFAMSTVSMSYIEDLARATSGRLWLQAYVFREREISDRLIDRAESGGCEAIIITSDFPLAGKRERDHRSGLLPKQEFPLRTKLDILRHPRWVLTVARNKPRFVNVERELGPGANVNSFVGHNMFDPSLDWDDLARFRDRWKRKLLLKDRIALLERMIEPDESA